MITSRRARIIVVVLLLCGHAILLPHYPQQPRNPDAWVLPRSGEFIESPDQYIGDRVVTGGIIQRVSPVVIEITTRTGSHELTITGGNWAAPAVGDKVRVYGILTGPRTIRAINGFVVPQEGLWYTWSVSFIAGIWVLFRLIRDWQLSWTTLSFRPRDAELSIQNWLPVRDIDGEQDDA